MVIFESESDLLLAITRHDAIVRKCIDGEMRFEEFCDEYNDFYAYYALDGHESDEEERLLLDKHRDRIAPHRVIACEILGRVCSDSDAQLASYKQAGRFGSAEAILRMKNINISGSTSSERG